MARKHATSQIIVLSQGIKFNRVQSRCPTQLLMLPSSTPPRPANEAANSEPLSAQHLCPWLLIRDFLFFPCRTRQACLYFCHWHYWAPFSLPALRLLKFRAVLPAPFQANLSVVQWMKQLMTRYKKASVFPMQLFGVDLKVRLLPR